ncbi:DUF6600 domain-containing protein [Steroidobacter sp.]|uniref:DUF6600 domain-containing protein n=1 Tax=Steroidobacter sp. TaxID=1978227 RepID=UPI0025FD6111|nr:DUF6600 domain-containing protein [Steroidobacter sp.]
MISSSANRRLAAPASSQLSGSNVTNSPTPSFERLRLFGLGSVAVLGLGWLAAAPNIAAAQEPVVEPEAVIESGEDVEPVPVVEPESATESSSRATPVVDPPSRVARLGYLDGEVTLAPAGSEEWAEASINRPLTSGDRLWVEKGGRAELQIGSAAVYLDGDTGFGFIELDEGVLQASLTEGAATIRVRRLAEGETIQIETPHSTVVLNRVGEYHLEVDKSADRTIVKTRHGEAEVKGGNQRFVVRDNERGVFAGVDNLSGQIDKLGSRTAFENWANDRDGRNERSKSAQYVSRDVVGYEDLDDNGEWISEPEYGYVWRPTYVASGWAPYRYGRWVYVSPWGWSWMDDARWGYAPFHYGRWASIRDRWCWVPGPRHIRPVYAPALVGWVGGPSVGISVSFGNVGWYPLSPRDVYYPGYRHTPRYIRYVNVSNTVIINNNYFYGRRLPPPRFDYRHYPGGVTTVSRDYFVGGRRIGDHWVRPDDNRLRGFHAERRPPSIAPYRESVLGGQVRQPPRDVDRFNNMGRGDYYAGRVPFNRERGAIESNGGRPIGRAELQDRGPKRGGDFVRPGSGFASGDNKRPEQGRALGLNERNTNDRNSTDRAPRELNNDSVRDWQNRRDRDSNANNNGGTLSRPGSNSPAPRATETRPRTDSRDRQREQLEIMRAEETTRSEQRRNEQRRNDQMERQPSNTFQQGGSSVYRPPVNDRVRERESSRPSPTIRSEPRENRQLSQPRSEPRRDYTPAPRVEPRAQPQPQAQPRADRPSNNNGGGGSKGDGNRGGNRPWNSSKER